MGRTINQIKNTIIAEKNNQPSLSGITSTSQVSIENIWAYVIAAGMFIQEQLWDVFKSQLETDIAKAPVGTDSWLQAQTYKFQYDSLTPQIIQLNNFVPSYDIVDPSKQIITRASVKTLPNRLVSVKTAKSEPPQALSNSELTSLNAYLDEISFAGVQYFSVSLPPDQLMVNSTIYFNGQYSSIISATTISAINNYLQSVPFDGVVKISALEDAIQAVPGVSDVVMNNVSLRPDSILFSGTTYLVQNNTEIYNKYPLYAGYAITELTSGHTLADTLIFIPA